MEPDMSDPFTDPPAKVTLPSDTASEHSDLSSALNAHSGKTDSAPASVAHTADLPDPNE